MTGFSIRDESLFESLIDILLPAGYKFYLVGGYVRDLIMGKSSNDLDITYDGDYLTVLDVLTEKGIKSRVYPEFMTIHFRLGEYNIDLTPFRKEKYSPNYFKPVKVERGTFIDDLLRRDFTINAVYYDFFNDRIIDPLAGIRDIENGLIRPIMSSTLSEDPSRILRMFHYKNKLGFKIEDNLDFDSFSRLVHSKIPENELIGQIDKLVSKQAKLLLIDELARYDIIIPAK